MADKREQLADLEAELAELEDGHDFEDGPDARIDELTAAIAAVSRELDRDADREARERHLEAERRRDRRESEREARERREWERWRYERSKLSPVERARRPLLQVGERECPGCEEAFRPANRRQKFCGERCRKAHHRRGLTV